MPCLDLTFLMWILGIKYRFSVLALYQPNWTIPSVQYSGSSLCCNFFPFAKFPIYRVLWETVITKPGMMAHSWNTSAWDVEAGRQVLCQPQPQSEFQSSLSYLRHLSQQQKSYCLKIEKVVQRLSRNWIFSVFFQNVPILGLLFISTWWYSACSCYAECNWKVQLQVE